MPGKVPDPVYCLRITHYENIPFILENGLHSPASEIKDPSYRNIGKKDIIEKRESKIVEVEPYGRIHDYVSFYFGPRSPMLYSIFKGNSDTDCIQEDIVYVVTSIPTIEANGLKFVFTTGQAIMQLSTQHNQLKDLEKIDWNIIRGKYWHDNPPEYVDRARKRMAEFLIHDHVPVTCVQYLAVQSKKMQEKVSKMVAAAGLSITVLYKPDWYYQ